MHPNQQKKLERETISEKLEVTIMSKSLVINGLEAADLNIHDLVEVSFGEVKSTFVVTGKELISKKVRMEEQGYWAKKLGRSLEKQEKCDFNNIVYSKIIDEEKIKQINEASCYC